MKHKAQEPLEFLFDEAAKEYELDEEYVDLICYDRTGSDEYLNPFWVIQDLINCQLTLEELSDVIRTLEYELPCYDLSSQVDKQIKIIKKLKRQKEMWESNND